ncbi:transketolase [Enterococcus pseudoavium]|uniref:Transketolase n=2 Tax=Enterococcus pseudoavium TaxID=44007 RepID=A0ABU3FGB2_9ENTE|nr:transketolase [Enterococcus pseudoavium]MDT2754142.1 transketolase [Enterococcus pseudoavium]MDT2770076.1 transketolase [Enterococcus pseudoavium]
MSITELETLAAKIRINSIEAIRKVGSGHIGGSLSIADLLAVLYGKQMVYDVNNPAWEKRDRLVLSKGHAGPALYSALSAVGFFAEDWLWTLNEGGTNLPSHPDRIKTPGVDATTGSLGQGTSLAAGIATGLKLQGNDNYVYLIVGDGELNEGQCWEAFQYIAHFKLNNCIVIIDENKKQLDGTTQDILNPFDIAEKMRAFGFAVQRVKGNDLTAIDQAIDDCKKIEDQAVCIVLDTIKGQGVKFFEEMDANHSVKFDNEVVQKATDKALEELRKGRGK